MWWEIFSKQEENSWAERTLSTSSAIFCANELSLLHCLIIDLYPSALSGLLSAVQFHSCYCESEYRTIYALHLQLEGLFVWLV